MRPGLRRSLMNFDQQLSFRPLPHNAQGAFCMKCRRPVDVEQLVEENHGLVLNNAKVLVRCHGEEELGEFQFGSREWDETDLKRAMQRRAWFDPRHNEVGGVPNKGEL